MGHDAFRRITAHRLSRFTFLICCCKWKGGFMSSVARIGDPIGSLVKFQRLQAGMTQGQLAKRSGLAVAVLSDLEAGVAGASDQDVQAIAGALGVERTTLLARLPEDLTLTDMTGLRALYKPQIP